MKRRHLLVSLPSIVILVVALHGAAGAETPSSQGRDASAFSASTLHRGRFGGTREAVATVAFSVSGLPAGLQPRVYVDEPAPGGGYFRIQFVGEMLSGSTTLAAGQYLEAAVLPLQDGERYAPRVRFQSADGGKTSFSFEYVHQYLVIISRESHGAYDPAIAGRAAGATSAESQWATAGSTFTVSASPEGRYRFSQWTTLRQRPGGSVAAATGRANPLRVRVDGPLHLVATFSGQ